MTFQEEFKPSRLNVIIYFEKRLKVISCSFSNFFLPEKGEVPGESTLTKVLPVWKSFDWNSSSQFYLICMGSISLSLSFNWNSSYSILFEMRAGSPNSRAADVRRVDWTLSMWFSYLDSLIKWSNTYIAGGSIPFLHKRTPWAPSIKGAIPNFCPGKDRRMDGKKTPCSFQISLEGLNTSLMHGSIECKLCTSFHRDFYFTKANESITALFRFQCD